MAQLTFTLSAADQTRAVNAVTNLEGYNAATDGTKAEFIQKIFIKIIESYVKRYEHQLAIEAADETFEATYIKPVIT